MKLTPEKILQQYTQSGKRHLFITGDRGAGKSTLFGRIVAVLSPGGEKLPGLTSFAVPKTNVVLRDNLTSEEGIVGIYCPEKATMGKNMIPYSDGFYSVGIPALKNATDSESRWVSMDEIGFLESSETEFQHALGNLLDKKQIIAVVRKMPRGVVPFLDELTGRSDVYLLDLDSFDKSEYQC